MRRHINKVTTDLSLKEGTVSYVFLKHVEEIKRVIETQSLQEAKNQISELIKNEAHKCASKNKILFEINSQNSSESLSRYMWNMYLSGTNNKVIR